MDTQDRERIAHHLQKLLDELKARRVMTNHEVRRVAGSRGMGRVNDLIKLHHQPIYVRKIDRSTWEVRFGEEMKPIAPDSTTMRLHNSTRSQSALW